MRPRQLVACLLAVAAGPLPHAAQADPASAVPFRLQDALGLPDWLSLSVQSRYRYETLDSQFRAGGSGGDQALVTQTTALLEAGSKTARLGLEMIDARAMLEDAGTTLDNTVVDSAELLQAYGNFRFANLPGVEGTNELKIGRQTLDFGSRRLVARNKFRNTINSFTGADWKFTARDGWSTEAFIAAPVSRLPTDKPSLLDNNAVWNEEDFGTLFWLASVRSRALPGGARLEGYVLGLHESDDVFATRNRDLVTPGFRLLREPSAAALDYQVEVAVQTGTVRADDKATTLRELDHFAHYETVQLGYTFKAAWSPRLAAMFDYASGDSDPTDGNSGRFDTLFGARRFDYGPTGLWGAFSRANLVSPGTRVTVKPSKNVQAMVGYRAFWLAEERDGWAAAKVSDASGRSGSFIGNELEFSVGWIVLPGNVGLEVGGALLVDGEFPGQAPNGSGEGDSSYLYTQVTLSF